MLFRNLVPARNRRLFERLRAFSVLLIAIATAVGASRGQDNVPSAVRADKILVLKKQHTLELLSQGKLMRKYQVALGGEPVGPKTHKGDHKTPEGTYFIDRRNSHSQFYRALHISYPNADDRARARKLHFSAGGDIMIHGLPNGYGWMGKAHRSRDWTDGCIAVTNEEMEVIWQAVADGTPVEIRP